MSLPPTLISRSRSQMPGTSFSPSFLERFEEEEEECWSRREAEREEAWSEIVKEERVSGAPRGLGSKKERRDEKMDTTTHAHYDVQPPPSTAYP